MKKLIKSFGWAMSGIRTVWQEEVNFRIETVVAFLVIVGGIYLQFTKLEWAFIIISICAVLSAEIVNTAVEDLCNKIEPNTDPIIGKIKDMMGGVVLLVCVTSVIIGVMVFTNHL
ncbi:MAG: diacylglycerol kinase [Candidatus Yonathbacteria bacterium CG10_big_fil_rev_8_21_14_0_10_43_136]|uniref:Diacylglycerol kinase n=1 Tax=Candidatus Yonathbacteria bacterium CG_4_10_14_0_8_um_filter_43_17 TaxID=1975099 RepID=A0A2M7Q4F0_9BACT|nr:MAG: diacylglycerol kinase [Candidatus Yonathbacteria bacterium CG17_big_fil_post_rev_8_21_14_2_50_43_9]PIR40602.1 MAG: diacylglycerol kinase [Candidatus Yonathbacteria bacterium CG10_big_fil_rev_8_21_14_0_10_43_136]PIX56843.1 MAG: diacylglycerol kinase [Candidatus Yonathbacteria bacterium CG_4_10_14_3_um_filter_43_12]PIY58301.1 MAG: diacylglycerol kinase [Candidatus Yonathbacteria bacterium CG_4_10_14_0_8_um_filter_43_17]PJC22607.1 MAG: diacylglycerol kinase [Candidatus Yonathbacteria bacte